MMPAFRPLFAVFVCLSASMMVLASPSTRAATRVIDCPGCTVDEMEAQVYSIVEHARVPAYDVTGHPEDQAEFIYRMAMFGIRVEGKICGMRLARTTIHSGEQNITQCTTIETC